MSLFEIALIGVSLSMDTFAVALSLGLQSGHVRGRDAAKVCLAFGLAQTLMPLLGFLLGSSFVRIVAAWSSWIAFALLALVGAKMIWDSVAAWVGAAAPEVPLAGAVFALPRLALLALAESIDALAVGVTFAFSPVNIIEACLEIGLITALIAFTGLRVGRFLGERFKSIAEVAGGLVLILLGVKALLGY
jgi:putative Mn2+ efflux pump MntP